MLMRVQYEKELNEMSSGEDEDLKMFNETAEGDQDEDERDAEAEAAEEAEPSRWKGKQRANDANDAFDDDLQAGPKRRRPRMDPFAGESHSKNFPSFWMTHGTSSGYGDDKRSSALELNTTKKNKTTTSAGEEGVSMAGPLQDNPSKNVPQFSTIASSKEEAKAARQAKKETKAARKAKKDRPMTE
jgi:exosome complex protein LRP1